MTTGWPRTGITIGALARLSYAYPIRRSISDEQAQILGHVRIQGLPHHLLAPREGIFIPPPPSPKEEHKHIIIASILALSLMLLAVVTIRCIIPLTVGRLAQGTAGGGKTTGQQTQSDRDGNDGRAEKGRGKDTKACQDYQTLEKIIGGGYVMVVLEDDQKREEVKGRRTVRLPEKPPAVVLKEELPLSPIMLVMGSPRDSRPAHHTRAKLTLYATQ